MGAAHGIGNDNVSELLCVAASLGDSSQVRTLALVGADVNKGDYDQRTAMYAPCTTHVVPALATSTPLSTAMGAGRYG